MSASLPGETREERESQGGGLSVVLSGGDEQSEPESLNENLPVVGETHENAEGAEAERRKAPPASALPCQYNHNCIEKEKNQKPSTFHLTPNQKRIRHKLIMGIEWMVRKHGIERVGVLTLSFGVPGSGKGSYETWALRQKAKQRKFVQNRWRSFRTNVVAKRYEDFICVFELQRDWVWHIHVVVATKEDIRTGTDIETLSNYKLPYWLRRGKHLRNDALAAEWKALREVSCRYRFGRVELLPIKKSGQAVGFYLGDYLVKTYNCLSPGQRCRLVRFSERINGAISNNFTIHGLAQLIHRTRLKIAARILQFQEYGDFADYFGPRWNYMLKNAIAWIPVPFRFPKGAFESGFSCIVLADYGEHPEKYLDERGKEKLRDASRELWRRLEETFEDDSEARLRHQVMMVPGDNTGDGPVTPDDLQSPMFHGSEDSF